MAALSVRLSSRQWLERISSAATSDLDSVLSVRLSSRQWLEPCPEHTQCQDTAGFQSACHRVSGWNLVFDGSGGFVNASFSPLVIASVVGTARGRRDLTLQVGFQSACHRVSGWNYPSSVPGDKRNCTFQSACHRVSGWNRR